jgi:hypothetical protein
MCLGLFTVKKIGHFLLAYTFLSKYLEKLQPYCYFGVSFLEVLQFCIAESCTSIFAI